MSTLGERIRIARELRGLEQTELALRIGIDGPGGNSTVSRWESGQHMPRAEHLAALVRELNIDGHWLLTGDGSPQIHNRDARRILEQIRGMVK